MKTSLVLSFFNRLLSLLPKLCLFFLSLSLSAQTLDLPLSKASSIYFRKQLYVFGLSAQQGGKVLVYRTDSSLKLKDSLVLNAKQKTAEAYLQFSADTLHGALEIFASTKNKNEGLQIFRPAPDFLSSSLVPSVEPGRLNNQQLFSAKKLISGTTVYDIRQSKDSSGLQFYVNAYERMAAEGNYDYRRTWQFPAERKGIYDAHLIGADERFVYVYAYRQNATEQSQWLLKLNAKTGELIKASKIASGKEVYRIGAVAVQKKGELILCGQVMRSNLVFWTCQLDSTGLKTELLEKPLALLYAGSPKKTSAKHLADITRMDVLQTGQVRICYRLFEQKDKRALMLVHSACSTLPLLAAELSVKQESLIVAPDIAFYFNSPDPMDRNGKIFLNDGEQLETLYQCVFSEQDRPRWQEEAGAAGSWLLIRTDVRKNLRYFARHSVENKKAVLKNLATIPLANQPWLQEIGNKKIVIGQQMTPETYHIDLYNW